MAISLRERYGKLLVRPKPERGESLYGYLSRLAELNGLEGIGWEACPRGALTDAEETPDGTLRYLAEAVALSDADLLELSYRLESEPGSGSWRFMGRCIRMDYFRRRRSAVCLECLNEHHSAPALWDLRLITACVHHEQWLVDRCPTCKVALSLRRRNLKRCPRGHVLEANHGDVQAPTKSVLEFTQMLEDELRGDLRPPPGRIDDLIELALSAFERSRKDVLKGGIPLELDSPHMTCTQRLDALAIAHMAPAVTNWPMPLFSLLREERRSDVDRKCLGRSEIHYANKYPIFRRLLGDDHVEKACAQFANLYRVDLAGHLDRLTKWMATAES
ncbi:hypothetical protein CBM2599_A10291 [Cupriavidus taiwanensis]|nr:hypothetical protein CBM2599_A10291 [Cupriavidus taiwanensis]SOY80479.1 hypothetical protein CBM2600_A10136 [Cupriavidus taiwanensis]